MDGVSHLVFWRTLRCKRITDLLASCDSSEKDVATLLDKEAINAVCREEKYTWKDRLLNPANTIHLFILQILNENTPLNDVPRRKANPSPVRPSAKHASGSLWQSSRACFAAWPTRSAPLPQCTR